MRLHTMLDAFKKTPGTVQNGPVHATRSGAEVLCLALELQSDGRVNSRGWELMRAFSLIRKMIEDVIREVDASKFSEEDRAFYTRDLPQITNSLSPANLAQPWANIVAGITPEISADLENLDRVLNRRGVERKLDAGDLAVLTSQIDEALEGLGELRMNDELREFIASHLLNIKGAVDQYRFRGIRGLQEALAGFAGSLVISDTQLHEAADEDQKPLLQRLYAVVQTGTGLINAAKGAVWLWPHMLEAATKLHHLAG